MERVEILRRIKEAEADAAAKKTDCEANCRRIIAAAEEDAKEIKKASENRRRKHGEAAMAEHRRNIRLRRAEILARGDKGAKALAERTQRKMGAVTAYIVSEFERFFDVQT